MHKKFRLGRTPSGVPVLVHWTVPALALFLLGVWVRSFVPALVGLTAYLATIFAHEAGHQWLAQRRGCRVLAIEIYPFHACCRFEPYVQFDENVVAWGGFLAQVVLGLPFALYVIVFGYTPWEPLNAVLAILGFIGPSIGALNMIPVAPLDGHRAWAVLPALFTRRRGRASRELTATEALEEALRKARRQ